MATIYLDNHIIQELASKRIGLDSLPTTNTYVITDAILVHEITDVNLRDKVLRWGQETGALRIEPVLSKRNFFDVSNLDEDGYNQFGVKLNPDGTLGSQHQLGDAAFEYLFEQGKFEDPTGQTFLLSNDGRIRDLSDEIARLNDVPWYENPKSSAQFLLRELEVGNLSPSEYKAIAPGLRRVASPPGYDGHVLSDEALDRLQIEFENGLPKTTFAGIEISPGVLTTAALGAEALRHAGIVGDVYEISAVISEANVRLDQGDTVGAEAIYAKFAGSFVGGSAVAFGAVLFAGKALVGSGVGVVPGAVILVAAGVAGGVAGSLVGEALANTLHNFAVNKLNNGEPLILDDLISLYHTELKDVGYYEEVMLTQALMDVDWTSANVDAAIQRAFAAAVLEDPELINNPDAFIAAVSNASLMSVGNVVGLPSNAEIADMFRVAEAVANKSCFLAGTLITLPDGSLKRIEDIAAGDVVLSYDAEGQLLPGRVTRTFQNRVAHVLDVFGLMVTPGHATLCGDGRFAGKHVPIIDILRSDGALVREDGTLVRANTGCDVGSVGDRMIHLAVPRHNDHDNTTWTTAEVRLGARFLLDDGTDIAIMDVLADANVAVTEDGLVIDAATGDAVPLHLPFVQELPKPEDYILARSGVTLADIYRADEWEEQRPSMPAPVSPLPGENVTEHSTSQPNPQLLN